MKRGIFDFEQVFKKLDCTKSLKSPGSLTFFDNFFYLLDCGLNKEERRNRFSFPFASGNVETVISNVSFALVFLEKRSNIV